MASLGLLQPLPIPIRNLSDISMDFIEGLPCFIRKNVIFIVVDRLSKYNHFIAISHLYSAMDITKLFINRVFFWLHGIPTTIVYDRDPIFTNTFWNTLFVSWKALNYAWALHITLNRMDKQRLLIVIWKLISIPS